MNQENLARVASMMNVWTRVENHQYANLLRLQNRTLKALKSRMMEMRETAHTREMALQALQHEIEELEQEIDDLSNMVEYYQIQHDQMNEANEALQREVRMYRQQLGLPVHRILPLSFSRAAENAATIDLVGESDSDTTMDSDEDME